MNTDSSPRRRSVRSMLQRIGRAIVREFTPPPKPRPSPTRADLLNGHSAVGVIRDALLIETPEGGYADDDLVIELEAAGPDQTVTLVRTVESPLLGAYAGRKLVGRQVLVRHTTLDPSYDNDILVEKWPADVERALTPFRPRGRGAGTYRMWRLFSSLGFVLGYGGIMLLVPSLCLLIATLFLGPEVADGFPAWLHPGVVFPASLVAVPVGFWIHAACDLRADTARSKIKGRAS